MTPHEAGEIADEQIRYWQRPIWCSCCASTHPMLVPAEMWLALTGRERPAVKPNAVREWMIRYLLQDAAVRVPARRAA